jgi:hypothetical protein
MIFLLENREVKRGGVSNFGSLDGLDVLNIWNIHPQVPNQVDSRDIKGI